MTQKLLLIITAVLLVSTAVYTYFVFFPALRPYEVVNVDAYVEPEIEDDTEVPIEPEETEDVDILLTEWGLTDGSTSVIDAKILNRELPLNWVGRGILFKYTYLGEYDDSTQQELDEMLVTEYKWQKQLDMNGNVVMGGIIFHKDGTYQLHTHNTFTKAQWRYLLGDLLDRYYSNNELVGTQIKFGSVILQADWYKDIELKRESTVPYADLIISTCLEMWGDKRLVSGWNVVEEE